MWWIFIGLIIVAIIIVIILISNSLNQSRIKIDEAKSDIEVALTKRYDVLTKMIDTVKSFAQHEEEMLFGVVKLRKGMTTQEQEEAYRIMNENVERCKFLAESYPNLRSSENYNTLQEAIADTEEHLQAARRIYNANISSYNQKLVTFPISIVAKCKKLQKESFFEAGEEKKNDVDIAFGDTKSLECE